MTLARTTDHVRAALDQLRSQFRERPNIEAFVSAFAAEVQQLEDAFFGLLVQRLLSSAVGVQLDVIGRILKRDRLGLGDDEYRAVLFAWIRANKSNGTANDVLDVLHLALQGQGATFDPCPPASFVVELHGPLTLDASVVALLVKRARLGGVGAQFVYTTGDEDEALVFASGDDEEESTTQGLADDDDELDDGGGLAEVAEA